MSVISYFIIFACCGLAVLVTLARRAAITDFSRNGLSKYLKNECNFVFQHFCMLRVSPFDQIALRTSKTTLKFPSSVWCKQISATEARVVRTVFATYLKVQQCFGNFELQVLKKNKKIELLHIGQTMDSVVHLLLGQLEELTSLSKFQDDQRGFGYP